MTKAQKRKAVWRDGADVQQRKPIKRTREEMGSVAARASANSGASTNRNTNTVPGGANGNNGGGNNHKGGGNHNNKNNGGVGPSSQRNTFPPVDSSFARQDTNHNHNKKKSGNPPFIPNHHTMTRQEEQHFHVLLRDAVAQRNTFQQGNRGHNQRPPFEHISGRTQQWPAILHPASVALVLVAPLLPLDSSLALLQNCVIRHCRTVGIPWLELQEEYNHENETGENGGDPTKSKSDRHRFLWDCLTDQGTAACLLFPCGTVDLKVLLEARSCSKPPLRPAAPPMSDSALDRFYSNMSWTRALCNAPEREQVYQLVLHFIAERQGYLPVEQELQQVLQLVEARTARLVLVSSQVWEHKLPYTLHLLKQCEQRKIPIFLVYDYHICNNKRFPAVWSVCHVHSAREWQLQDLQELCRTMSARPLLLKVESPSTSTSALGADMSLGSASALGVSMGLESASALGASMGLGSGVAGGPSIPTARSSIQTAVAHPIGGVLATAAAAKSSTKSVPISRQDNSVPPPPVLPPFPQPSSREAFGRPLSLPPPPSPADNSTSIGQGELQAVAARAPEKAAGTRPVPLPPPPPPEGARHAAVSESESPADLILSPEQASVREQDRFLKMLAGHEFKINQPPYHLVSSLAFETEKWPRWLHPDRIGFVLFVQPNKCYKTRSATMIFSSCLIRYCQKVGIPCLRLRKEEGDVNHGSRMISNNDVALCFDQSLVDLKYLLDPERRPDLLLSTMARRAPSKLSSDLGWSIAIAGWEERNMCMKFRRNETFKLPVMAQIARVSQMVEETKALIVIIASSIWQEQVEVAISLIQRCIRLQIAVFLVHDRDFGEDAQLHAILSVNKDSNADGKMVRSLQAVSQRLLAREVPLRLAQVLPSCMDPFCTLSEANLVRDLLIGVPTDRPGNNGSPDESDSSSAVVSGADNVKAAIDQKKAHLVFVSLTHEATLDATLFACLKFWWEAKTPLLFLRNDTYGSDKAGAFCLTSVRPEDEYMLRSLLTLAADKRKDKSSEVALSGNVEKGAGVSMPGKIDPTRHSAGFVQQSTFPLERQIVVPSPEESSVPSGFVQQSTFPSERQIVVPSAEESSVPSVRRWRAGVLSDGYPWWSSVAHCLEAEVVVTMIKEKLPPAFLSRLPETHTVVQSPDNATDQERFDHMEKAMSAQTLDIMMIDGVPPGDISKLWERPDLKLIVSTGNRKCRRHRGAQPGWNHSRVVIDHKLVGGVSNGRFGLNVWTRSPSHHKLQHSSNVPKKDLRSVMKIGVFGRHALPLSLSDQVGDEVIELSPKVVSVGGLYPSLTKKPLSEVRTRFDGATWCDRTPSVDELLLMWEVPGTLSNGLSSDDKIRLESSVKAPLRLRRILCASLAQRLELATPEIKLDTVSMKVITEKLPKLDAETEERLLGQKRARPSDFERLTLVAEAKSAQVVIDSVTPPTATGERSTRTRPPDLLNGSASANTVSPNRTRDSDFLYRSGLEMAARPDHPSTPDARSAAVRHWKDGLCDPSESKAVLQLLEKCQFSASSADNPFIEGSQERIASASVILSGVRTVTSCVLEKRAILVFVALNSGGASGSEAVFALVELCRELGTPFLFVQEVVCVKEVVHIDLRQQVVFCLTFVRAEDEDVLRGLKEVAGIKRIKVFGDSLQSEIVESCVNTAVSERIHSLQHGVGLVAKEKQNAVVEDVTNVLSIEPTDKELFLLEEEVSLLETSLESLRARKDEVEVKLVQKQDKRVHQVESIANLQSRSEQLQTAQTRQLELEKELTRSIDRSRTQLDRLTGHGSVLSTSDISGLSGAEGGARVSGGDPDSSATKDPEESVSNQPAREELETNLSLRKNSARLLNPVDTQKIPGEC